MDISNNTKKFWKKLKVNDVVGLQDKQAIEDQMEEDKELGETDYKVESIATFVAEGNQGCLAEFLLIELENEEETILLLVKIVDDTISLWVYFEVDEFEQGNREDVLDRGDDWVFQSSSDPYIKISELEYAKVIEQTIDDESTEFELLPQGELHGSCKRIPEETGIGDIFMTLVEYAPLESECENPYIMITEEESINTEDDDDEDDVGGNITVHLGSDLSPLDINIYPKGK